MVCCISTNACTTVSNRRMFVKMNSATLNLFSRVFFLTFTTTMHSINICPCWQITKFPSDPKLHLDSGAFSWISKQCRVVGDAPPWSLFPCLAWVSSLALLTICLVFFTLPFSFQTVECTHRWLCHHDMPFLHAGILNIQKGYHLRRQLLHMWWEGRIEKDVGKRVMGSWYRRMDLCTYYLDTLYTYIYIQMYIHAKRVHNLNLETTSH